MRQLISELRAGKRKALRRFLWRERRTWAYLLLAGMTFWGLYKVEQLASESHRAICAQRANTEEQIKQTTDFLVTHPGAEPFPGVTRVTLQQGLDRQRRFVEAISFVDCP